MKLFDLTGETAVVIGGTGVLGGAIAHGLADAGAKVTVIGRTKRSELPFVAADATNADSLSRAHEQTGTPTILVNAAGGNDPKATVTLLNSGGVFMDGDSINSLEEDVSETTAGEADAQASLDRHGLFVRVNRER